MPTTAEQNVANRLADLRPALVARVAERLAASLPMVGVPPGAAHRAASHHAQMHSTAQRFHDLLQVSVATGDWGQIGFEYKWAAGVLGPKGVSWEHQLCLIERYFATARELDSWSDEELAALDRMAAELCAVVEPAYNS